MMLLMIILQVGAEIVKTEVSLSELPYRLKMINFENTIEP